MLYNLVYNIYNLCKTNIPPFEKTGKPLQPIFKNISDIISDYVNRSYNNGNYKQIGKISNKQRKYSQEKIAISLTTYPARINTIHLVVKSLLNQSVQADAIILWLAETQFNGMDELPKELVDLTHDGLQIKFCKDIKSHKKYYYTFQDKEYDLVILVDDDFLYPPNLIEKLYNMHLKHPNDVICWYFAIASEDYRISPSKWGRPQHKQRIYDKKLVQPFTGSGTLYPRAQLPKEIFNMEVIENICPYADDLWLYFCLRKANIGVIPILPLKAIPISLYQSDHSSLWLINGPIGGQNDIQWANLIDKYGSPDE